MAKYKAKIANKDYVIEADTKREAALKLRNLKKEAEPIPEESELTEVQLPLPL